MCGIASYLSFGKKEVDVNKFNILMLYNDTRGGHSSGIYNGKTTIKEVGESYNILPLYEPGKIMIGHTRYGTHGVLSKDNSHPFTYGKYTGCHNGVLGNHDELCEKYNLPDTDVDSKTIFQLMNKIGIKATIENISGTAAIVAHDTNENKFIVYRSGNPLFAGRTEEGLYFSSIKDPLTIIRCDNIIEIPKETILIFDNQGKLVYECKDVKMKVEHYEVKNWDSFKTIPMNSKTSNVNSKMNDYPIHPRATVEFEDLDDSPIDYSQDEYLEDKIIEYKDLAKDIDVFLGENMSTMEYKDQAKVLDVINLIEDRCYTLKGYVF